jgi:hypothetical protein
MLTPTFSRLSGIQVDRFVRNFVNLGHLYSKPFRRGCSAFLPDGTNVIWEVDLNRKQLTQDLKLLRDFKERIKDNHNLPIDTLWVKYITSPSFQANLEPNSFVRKSFSPVETYPFFPQYELAKSGYGGRRVRRVHEHPVNMIVLVNYGRNSRWYSVFAENDDISRGYQSHSGPHVLPNTKRRDVLPTAQRGERWCSQDRVEAQQNRKGCLFGDVLIPHTAPRKDLFLEYLKPLVEAERITEYTESAEWATLDKKLNLQQAPAGEVGEAKLVEPKLISMLDHNLSEYCNEVARSWATSHKAAITWIWRSTALRTDNEWAVHKTWKARALLFKQLEQHALYATPDMPFNLTFTPEIITLLSGLKAPLTVEPRAQSSSSKEISSTSFGNMKSRPLITLKSTADTVLPPLDDNFFHSPMGVWHEELIPKSEKSFSASETPTSHRSAKSSTLPSDSYTPSETAKLRTLAKSPLSAQDSVSDNAGTPPYNPLKWDPTTGDPTTAVGRMKVGSTKDPLPPTASYRYWTVDLPSSLKLTSTTIDSPSSLSEDTSSTIGPPPTGNLVLSNHRGGHATAFRNNSQQTGKEGELPPPTFRVKRTNKSNFLPRPGVVAEANSDARVQRLAYQLEKSHTHLRRLKEKMSLASKPTSQRVGTIEKGRLAPSLKHSSAEKPGVKRKPRRGLSVETTVIRKVVAEESAKARMMLASVKRLEPGEKKTQLLQKLEEERSDEVVLKPVHLGNNKPQLYEEWEAKRKPSNKAQGEKEPNTVDAEKQQHQPFSLKSFLGI